MQTSNERRAGEKMKRILTYIITALMMICPAVMLTACGGDTDSTETTQTEAVTEESIEATEAETIESEGDDAGGCIENSEDLLY